MKKTQTKTALMKIKVKQVSISSIKKKKNSLLLFSFVYFLKCLEYSSCIFLFGWFCSFFLGVRRTSLIHWSVFLFVILNKCSTFDCSLQNASVLK